MPINDRSSKVCPSDLIKGEETVTAELNQPFWAKGGANDQRVLQRKKRRGRRRFQHNGYIRRLVATVGQINGRGGIRSPRYPRQNDVCFFPILPIHPVIMRNGKLYGVNAGEISFVHNVFAPRAIATIGGANV